MNQSETIQTNNGLTVKWLNTKTGETVVRNDFGYPGKNYNLLGAFVDGVLSARATRKAEEAEEYQFHFLVVDFLTWVGNNKFYVIGLVTVTLLLIVNGGK